MDLTDIKIGAEGDLKIVLEGGVFKLSFSENTPGIQANLSISIPPKYFLDALAAKANSPIVSGVVNVIEAVIAGIPA